MGLISVLIGGIAVHVVSEYSEKLRLYENAADRAFLGEHLNRQVTAVVMEARGVYASKDTEGAAKFAEGIGKELDGIDRTLNEWRPLVPEAQKAAFDAVVARAAEFRTFRAETARLGTEVSPAAANEQGNNKGNRANRKAFQKEIDAVVATDNENLTAIRADVAAFETAKAPRKLPSMVCVRSPSASAPITRRVSAMPSSTPATSSLTERAKRLRSSFW